MRQLIFLIHYHQYYLNHHLGLCLIHPSKRLQFRHQIRNQQFPRSSSQGFCTPRDSKRIRPYAGNLWCNFAWSINRNSWNYQKRQKNLHCRHWSEWTDNGNPADKIKILVYQCADCMQWQCYTSSLLSIRRRTGRRIHYFFFPNL